MTKNAPERRNTDVASLLSPANPSILAIAHRGVWTHAPENSLASIRAATVAGADLVEIDVQTTADDVPVLLHDDTLDRTTSQGGLVRETPFGRIADARLRAGDRVTTERLPTLTEALEEARGRIVVNIDTKHERDFDVIARTVSDLGMAGGVLIKSSVATAAAADHVRAMWFFGQIPYMPYAKVQPGRLDEVLERCAPLQPAMIELKFLDLTDIAAAGNRLRRAGIRLWVNTLGVSHSLDLTDARAIEDPDAVWGILRDAGVGAIQTDAMAPLKEWLSGSMPIAPGG